MPKYQVKFKGEKEMQKKLQELAKKYPEEIKGALYRQAEYIMTDSKRIVPWDDGHLRASGHVIPDETKIGVTLGYGGPAGSGNVGGETNEEDVGGYAIVQHENESFNHPRGGEAKYLEKPFLAAASHLAADIAKDLKR